MFLTVDDDQDNTADRAEAAASHNQQKVPVNVWHKNTSLFSFSVSAKKIRRNVLITLRRFEG